MDTSLNLALQQLSPALDGVMRFLSFLGQEEMFVIVIGLVYWCLDSRLGARFLLILVMSDYVNGLLKWAFHLPRPYWIDARVKPLSTELSYGLPSGHAQASLTAYGYLALMVRRRWLWIGAALLILGIAASRVYLGVHFATDILGGWFMGGMVLVAVTRLEPRVTRWIAPKPIGFQIAAVVTASILMLALSLSVRAALNGVIDPAEWPLQAGPIDPRAPDTQITDLGLLFGAGLGLVLQHRTARFAMRGSWRQRGLRLLIGVLGVMVIRFALGAIFPRDPLAAAMIFRFIRYAVIGLWLIWLAPLVFVKLRLADRAAQTDRVVG